MVSQKLSLPLILLTNWRKIVTNQGLGPHCKRQESQAVEDRSMAENVFRDEVVSQLSLDDESTPQQEGEEASQGEPEGPGESMASSGENGSQEFVEATPEPQKKVK